jgi:hypothetical protein
MGVILAFFLYPLSVYLRKVLFVFLDSFLIKFSNPFHRNGITGKSIFNYIYVIISDMKIANRFP